MNTKQKIYKPIKRFFDIILSILGILILTPLLWWWILLINIIATGGHPIFVHKRLGYKKKVFGCLKFRSMRMDADPYKAPSKLTEEDQVMMDTKFGKFLRKTSIDETLQLFNILVGQMSFIGPRPGAAINEDDLVAYREKYTPNAFDAKPGLSGLAQVKMHREHDPDLKARYDHEYVMNMSFGLDVKIFFMTGLKIFTSIKGR